jgi:acetyl esterase/lipase
MSPARIALVAFGLLQWQRVFAQASVPTTQGDSPMQIKTLRLWQGDAPGAMGQKDYDIPTLTIYPAPSDRASGAAMIVCPGGGYTHLADHEGEPVARWLNTLGITAGVLKYRLGSHGYRHPVELEDMQRAVRFFRSDAAHLNLDPSRIGAIGFSAGGHLVSTVATHFDSGNPQSPDPIERVSCRPDVVLLIYPVITMGKFSQGTSRKALLGANPDPKLIAFLSNETQVTSQTPPCFLVHTNDDRVAPVENSIAFARACRQNHVPVELHIFEHGPHGFGMGTKDPALSTWPADAALFLARHGFLTKRTAAVDP